MYKRNLSILLTHSVFIILLLLLSSKLSNKVFSVASHLVISEVQIAGTTSKDEFVELYNPTNFAVDLSGWRLTRKTAGGTESNLVASMSGIIAPHGYFLIAHPDYDEIVGADIDYSAVSGGIATNNTVTLYSDAGLTVIDKVGMGSAGDFETSATDNPSSDGSLERKAFSTSTAESMGAGGADELSGNGEDSNNNSSDFVLRDVSDPQNSTSPIESPPATSPTPSPTATPSPTTTVTPSPSPSVTSTPTPTTQPTPTPSVKRKFIGAFLFPGRVKVCYLQYRPRKIGFFVVHLPKIVCEKL